jgi:hypothetical protein
MKKEIRELLERPFAPEQIKQRQGNFGQMLDYVEGHEIIQRLNDTFDADWSFTITLQEIKDNEVVVLGRLSTEGIIKEQFGSAKITKNTETNAVISIGDDLKAAATDALKKCATLLGVGLHLYRNDQASNGKNNTQKDSGNGNNHFNKGNGGNGSNGGNGNGNGRATDKQLKAIFAIAQDKNISNKGVRDLCVDTFGKVPDYLSKEEASKVIQELSAR